MTERATVIVFAMHGVPPLDFPVSEDGELMSLPGRIHQARPEDCKALAARERELDEKVRT